MNETVTIALLDGHAAARPDGYLGPERFDAYRAATSRAGARYRAAEKAQWCGLTRVPALLAELERERFAPAVTPELAAALAQYSERLHAEGTATEARLRTLAEGLAARGERLYSHQPDGIAWLAGRHRAALGDSPGLGKTQQALLAAPPDAPVIAVCPASVKLVWAAECRRWTPQRRVRVLRGRHRWEWPMAGELVITNYEGLPKLDRHDRAHRVPESYGAPAPGTIVIGDEAHSFKSAKAQRTSAFRAVVRAALATQGRAWLLTGTPMLNKPPELWTVLQAAQLGDDAFTPDAIDQGDPWKAFMRLFGARQGRFGILWGGGEEGPPTIDPSVPERLRRVMLYRRREDVLDLPPKQRQAIEVPGQFPPDVRKLLDHLLEALLEQGVNLDEAAELVDLTTVTGAAFTEWSKAMKALAIAKIPAMLEQIEAHEETGEPLIVFSTHRDPIDLLAKRPGWVTVTGDTPISARQRAVEQFQAGACRGIALTVQAGGLGITLTRGAHELFVDLPFTPAAVTQAEDRAVRIGQTRSVLIRRLVADHELDRRIEQILRRKQELLEAAIEPCAVTALAAEARAPMQAEAARLAQTATTARRAVAAPAADAAPVSLRVPAAAAPSRRHPPHTPVEAWIVEALQRLAALDPDHAAVRNDAGFNGTDGEFGHSLARQAVADGLSESQYRAARAMLAKYQRQVGRCPEEAASAAPGAPARS